VRNNRVATVLRQTPSGWRTRTKVTPAGLRSVHSVRLVLDLLPSTPDAAAPALPLWEGTAQARSSQADPLAVAPELIRRLTQRLPPRRKAGR
jgi:hypothetical protein